VLHPDYLMGWAGRRMEKREKNTERKRKNKQPDK